MLMAALLAMALAAAAPAFAQTATGGSPAILQYSCNQIQAAVNLQYQKGDNGSGAVAGAAQSLGVNQQQVLACFGTAAAAQNSTVNVNTAKAAKVSRTATAKARSSAKAIASSTSASSAPAALPPTGGASVIALGAAVMLVIGGLLARRLVR